MKCPRCGHEMVMDNHRRMDMYMCYDCGYIEGRDIEQKPHATNFERLQNMNLNESIAFLSENFGIDERCIAMWMENRVA